VAEAVTTGLEVGKEDEGTLREEDGALRVERTSDAELEWTVAAGIG